MFQNCQLGSFIEQEQINFSIFDFSCSLITKHLKIIFLTITSFDNWILFTVIFFNFTQKSLEDWGIFNVWMYKQGAHTYTNIISLQNSGILYNPHSIIIHNISQFHKVYFRREYLFCIFLPCLMIFAQNVPFFPGVGWNSWVRENRSAIINSHPFPHFLMFIGRYMSGRSYPSSHQ